MPERDRVPLEVLHPRKTTGEQPEYHCRHCLPSFFFSFFKLCLYVYKSLNGHAPQYLTDSLKLNPAHHRDQSLALHLITPFLSFHLPEHKMGIKLLLPQGLPYGTLFNATFMTLQILTVSKRSSKQISSNLSNFVLLCICCCCYYDFFFSFFFCRAAIMFLELAHYKFCLLWYVMFTVAKVHLK